MKTFRASLGDRHYAYFRLVHKRKYKYQVFRVATVSDEVLLSVVRKW